jgi:hypothetical protein
MQHNLAAGQAGNKQVASLIEGSKQDYSWKAMAFKVATIGSLALLAGSWMYECYQLHKSNEDLFSKNIEFGKQYVSAQVSGYINQIANYYPNWQCHIGCEVVDLLNCYSQGMTNVMLKA